MLLYNLVIIACLQHILYGLPLPEGGCQHAGLVYGDGDEVTMEDPCVRCRCAKGVLVCRLRVCNPQPHPPPHGCVVLSRPSECCPRLICAHETIESRRRLSDNFLDDGETPSGCVVNGTMYAEGSAMDSSTRCQYCYCIKGQQHCVKPQCLLAETNCTPTYTTDSCCPSKYDCSNITTGVKGVNLTTTTPTPTSGCFLDGRLYPEGELVPDKSHQCQNCYCLTGKLHCEPVTCSVPVNEHCVPVVTIGQCCPVGYNCSNASETSQDRTSNVQEDMIAQHTQSIGFNHIYVNSERSITNRTKPPEKEYLIRTTPTTMVDSTTNNEETTMIDSTITTSREDPTTMIDAITEKIVITEVTTETTQTVQGETTLPPTTTNTGFADVDQRYNSKADSQTTTSKNDELTTINNAILDDTVMSRTKNSSIDSSNSTTSSTTKALPSELEEILNETKGSEDDDYDYDYNEPSLPPSLPNLRIIPFVAADAVVEESDFGVPGVQEKSGSDNHFFENSHPSGFSPPSETEGGFVPKESMLDGPFYESKYDSNYHAAGNNGANLAVDITSATLASLPIPLPAITEPPKTAEEGIEKCVRDGQSYRHGELLSEPSACDLCMCYYGTIICQEPKCPVPESGCRLLRERDQRTCCRKIICRKTNLESPTRVVEPVTPPPHLPPFTVADLIVTPDPFRDVIRTEPAPDLSSLIGEIVPYFWDQSTRNTLSSTTPISITTPEPTENTTDFVSTTVQPSSTLIISSTTPTTSTSTSTQTSTTTRQETTTVESTSQHKNDSSESTTSSKVFTTTTTIQPTTSVSLFDLFGISENETKAEIKTEDANKEVKEEEPAEDEFSFDSVFSYLFDSDRWTTTTTTENPPLKTSKPFIKKSNNTLYLGESETFPNYNESKPSILQTLEHRSDENVEDLINNLNESLNETTQKPTIPSVSFVTKTETILTTEQTTTTVKSTTTVSPTTKNPIYQSTTKPPNVKISTKRFGTKYPTTPKYPRPPVTSIPSMSVPDPGAASGLLKLAGCNIYGRMYRVGRIISELSGPCLECMCTEVGVQCHPLKC